MSRGAHSTEREALIALAHAVEPGDARVGALIDRWSAIGLSRRLLAGEIGIREQGAMRARLARVDVSESEAAANAIGARIIVRGDREWLPM